MEFLATLSRMQALAVLHLENVLPSARGLLSSGVFNASPAIYPVSLAFWSLLRYQRSLCCYLAYTNTTKATNRIRGQLFH